MIRLVLLIFVSISSSSVFATQMQIKLLNQSGQTIKTDKVYWSAVGKPRPNICFWETTLQNGGSSIGTCTEQPSTDRWKRKVFLQFYCVDDVTFQKVKYPRNRLAYGRNHLIDNNGVYTIRILESDC